MKLKSFPPKGATRMRTRFAFLPTVMSNGDRIWLERYQVRQEYRVERNRWVDHPDISYWYTTGFKRSIRAHAGE